MCDGAYETPNTVANCRISILLDRNDFIFTFRFVRRREGDLRVGLDVDYVASDELGNLVRLGIVRAVHFTYAIRSVQHITILLNMFIEPSMMYKTAGPK